MPGWVHLIEMAPAIWGWSHSSQLSWEPGVIVIPVSPRREWRSKSAHRCFRSADHCVTTLTSNSPNRCPSIVPLASMLIRCGYFFFLTLWLIFPVLLNVCFFSCFSIADSVLIVFYWLSLAHGPPISSFLCLWFYEHVCICSDVFVFLPADLTSFFFC